MGEIYVEVDENDKPAKQGNFVEATLELGRNLVTTAVMAAASAKVMGNEIGVVLQPFIPTIASSAQALMAVFLLSISLFWLVLSGMRYFKYFESNFRKKGGFIKFAAAAPLMILAGLALVVLTFGAAAIGIKK